ncbi:MAG TPA: hypothetical protein DEQ34_09205 [Balneolaceae bacterium]|nr:hypothetical protein [Balneolaceae bacterium]|tara:strand:- start:133625 stop:134374 length:750 start_codon:yes stop_codon:yes gene_type:complete
MIESNFNKELEEKIDLYVNGRLSQEEVDELWAELIQDEYYLDYTKSVANLKAVIEAKREEQTVAPVYSIRKYVNYGVAAAIALIIGVVGIMNYSANTSTDSVNPLSTLELNVYRDANNSPALTNNSVIKEAIQLAANGEVEEAISMLELELEQKHSNELTAEISLTLGSIQYNYGNYEEALDNFLVVVELDEINDEVLEKGYWYLGNAYFQLDRLEEARVAFEKTYDMNLGFSRVAKSYLDALSDVTVK